MKRHLCALAAAVTLVAAMDCGGAFAQKQGGILRQYINDSPASMSIHEETTVVAERPMMAVFNNLVLFDQHVAQNSLSDDRARARHRLGLGRGRHQADLPSAPGREMA